jgi:hypothetical protein
MTGPTAVGATDQANLAPPVLAEGIAEFEALLGKLRPLLDRLWAAPALPRLEYGQGGVPKLPGVYLFSLLDGPPIYLGQSRDLNRRLAEHCRPGSGQNKASFAFNIAKKTAANAGVLPAGSRADIAVHEDFVAHFVSAKELVEAMPVRFVLESDPHPRTVFEVYATLLLNTKEFNPHETH